MRKLAGVLTIHAVLQNFIGFVWYYSITQEEYIFFYVYSLDMALRHGSVPICYAIAALKSKSLSTVLLPSIFRTIFKDVPLKNRCLHTSATSRGMEEFFDDPANWGEREVKVGRGWRVGELRIKSNEDLHKLWYVLLKELNMLLTMEYAAKIENFALPNPERIDKVKDSMANIETVVKERNKAYMLLETGETGERPGGVVKDIYGRVMHYDFTECHVPAELNPFHHRYKYIHHPEFDELNKLYKEKLENDKKEELSKKKKHVVALFSKFPDLDVEALKERYPELDIDKIRHSKEARAHCDHNLN